MIRAISVARGEGGRASAGTVTLDHWERHKRRIALRTDQGLEFLLDLAKAVVLQEGDGLVLEDGRAIAVKAMVEPLLEVRTTSPEHLARLAWHIGNRHLAAEIRTDTILISADHVIADMLRGLGAEVREVQGAFRPEGGAYAGHSHSADSHEQG
ncbi:MAG: urease accessory protein UreE [Bauldia sp.]